jgi:nucleoside-diphosphate-sugar epimerase
MASKVLITGASGFIGRHVVSEALKRNMEVYAAVRSSSNRQHLTDPRIHFFPFDMDHPAKLYQDLKRFQSDMGGFQFVIHNAAITVHKDYSEFVKGNADFSREFSRMLMETQSGMRKFVYMSSMASIGPGDPETMLPIDEKHARRPVTPYGHSKLLGERYLHEIEELPYIILRPGGVYGPGDEKFVLRVIGLMRKGLELSIGPVDQLNSFVHSEDLSWLALQACVSNVSREDFNVGDGQFYTQAEFNSILKRLLGVRTVPVRFTTGIALAIGYASYQLSKISGKPARLTHEKLVEVTARNWKIDITKARQLLGYNPQFDLEKGLKDVIETL